MHLHAIVVLHGLIQGLASHGPGGLQRFLRPKSLQDTATLALIVVGPFAVWFFKRQVDRWEERQQREDVRRFAVDVAVTLAKYCGSETLLIEGDLHRPTLASMFGLKEVQGLGDWWAGRDPDISRFLIRFHGSTLWFLPAGKAVNRPSDILNSARLEEAFKRLADRFDWIVVDSTPMLPVIDANLWSRLVGGTLLVIREGMAPLKALKNGLLSLDHPKLIGVIVNEASEFDQTDYNGQYYASGKNGDLRSEK